MLHGGGKGMLTQPSSDMTYLKIAGGEAEKGSLHVVAPAQRGISVLIPAEQANILCRADTDTACNPPWTVGCKQTRLPSDPSGGWGMDSHSSVFSGSDVGPLTPAAPLRRLEGLIRSA